MCTQANYSPELAERAQIITSYSRKPVTLIVACEKVNVKATRKDSYFKAIWRPHSF